MTIRLEFDSLPPTDAGGNARGHWGKTHRAREGLRAQTWALLQDQGLLDPGDGRGNPALMEKVVVTYHAYWCREAPDNDNLVTGCKAILDEIVSEGLLVDDKPRYVTIASPQYTQVAHMNERRLVVTVEEA